MDVDVGYAKKLGLELECRLIMSEKERLVIAHKEELQQIQGELSQSKLAFKRLLSKFERWKKILLGYRSAVRRHCDLSSLLQNGGHAKAQKRLARTIVGDEFLK